MAQRVHGVQMCYHVPSSKKTGVVCQKNKSGSAVVGQKKKDWGPVGTKLVFKDKKQRENGKSRGGFLEPE